MNTEPYLLAALSITLALLLGYGAWLWWRSRQLNRRQIRDSAAKWDRPHDNEENSRRGRSQ